MNAPTIRADCATNAPTCSTGPGTAALAEREERERRLAAALRAAVQFEAARMRQHDAEVS